MISRAEVNKFVASELFDQDSDVRAAHAVKRSIHAIGKSWWELADDLQICRDGAACWLGYASRPRWCSSVTLQSDGAGRRRLSDLDVRQAAQGLTKWHDVNLAGKSRKKRCIVIEAENAIQAQNAKQPVHVQAVHGQVASTELVPQGLQLPSLAAQAKIRAKRIRGEQSRQSRPHAGAEAAPAVLNTIKRLKIHNVEAFRQVATALVFVLCFQSVVLVGRQALGGTMRSKAGPSGYEYTNTRTQMLGSRTHT